MRDATVRWRRSSRSATRLAFTDRPDDLIGCLGGEEFGILMPGWSHDDGLVAANRIRQALASTPMVLDP